MTTPSGPRASGRPSPNGHVPGSPIPGSPSRRPSPRPERVAEPEPPTEHMPVVEPGDSTQAQPVIGPLSESLFGGPAPGAGHGRAEAEPPTDIVPVVAPRPAARAPEPPTEAVPVVRQEPPTAAVKTIPPDLFTQHLPMPGEKAAAATAVVEPEVTKKRRLPVDLGPGALRRTWRASEAPKPVRRAFLAALLVPAVHVLTIVLGLVFVAVAYGAYSLGTVLVGNVLGVVGWLVAALVAVWVGVQARAGRLWAAIALAVLAVVALLVTIDLALTTLTWIGLSGLPGVIRLVLLVIAALLCVAVPALMVAPLRRGYFRARTPDL